MKVKLSAKEVNTLLMALTTRKHGLKGMRKRYASSDGVLYLDNHIKETKLLCKKLNKLF
jgi:hypothetical protein